ncbi:MAG: peroxiredoxin family protein, partial [Actinomycetota bacterium]
MSTSTSRRPVRSTAVTRRRGRPILVAVAVVAVLGVLFGIYRAATGPSSADGTTPPTAYEVGSPGPGQQAPEFTLPLAAGGQVNLADYRGQTVLLYFQEGLMCQPCWTQITDLERASADVNAAGVDAVLSITSDPAGLLAQKLADEGITTPVASDEGLATSRQYSTNQYGMM